MLYLGKSIKKLNKLVNYDLKNLLYRLNANKISLNVKKTELVVFKSKRKQFDDEIKLKLSRKRLFPTDSVKYLGVKIDGNLSWKSHIDYLSVKLSRASSLLFKIRNFVYSSELYISLYLSHILITAVLYGLRIVMQFIDLSFYKRKLLELLTFSHKTLTLVLYSKEVLF